MCSLMCAFAGCGEICNNLLFAGVITSNGIFVTEYVHAHLVFTCSAGMFGHQTLIISR